MRICRALLKYGLGNFRLDILQYCNSEDVLSVEQYYLDKFSPQYNILKIAGASTGHRHTAEVKQKIRAKIVESYSRGLRKKSNAKQIKVINIITKEEKNFDSIRQTAKELNINCKTIVKYLNKNIAYNNLFFEVFSPRSPFTGNSKLFERNSTNSFKQLGDLVKL
jgi:hypothetical protein